MSTQTNADNTQVEANGVKMSVKNARRIDFSVDMSRYTDYLLDPVADRSGEKNDGKIIHIAHMSARRLKAKGFEDVFVEVKVYTKPELLELRMKQKEAVQKAAALEAVLDEKPELVEALTSLGFTREEILQKLTATK